MRYSATYKGKGPYPKAPRGALRRAQEASNAESWERAQFFDRAFRSRKGAQIPRSPYPCLACDGAGKEYPGCRECGKEVYTFCPCCMGPEGMPMEGQCYQCGRYLGATAGGPRSL